MTAAISRRNFMGMVGGSAAAAAALSACGSNSDAASETSEYGDGDAGILNFLLTVEYVQEAFYAELGKSKLFTVAAREALGKFGEEEGEHIGKLVGQVEKLEAEPIAKPKTKFELKTEAGTLEIASTLENVGAAAYLGQLPNIESDPLLKLVLSIHSVEGRHGASINDLLKKPVTPDGPFAKPKNVRDVIKAMKPYMA